MKIAIATKDRFRRISGHAGRTTQWLIFDISCKRNTRPIRIELTPAQLPHFCADATGHPLAGVDVVVAASAGNGFIKHMSAWGAQTILTGESTPDDAIRKILAEMKLKTPRLDMTRWICGLHERFTKRDRISNT